MMSLYRNLLPLAALALVVVGCQPPEEEATVTQTAKVVKPYVPTAQAGIPVQPRVDPNALKPLIARASRFGSRSNPFVLLKDEIYFEKAQAAERLFQEDSSFPVTYEPPQPSAGTTIVVEAQPYRRLSGIVIGDAVVGILETQGQPTVLIRPGQLIPGTDWRVVALNEDRAILRRPGNRRPNEITVKLESPPPGFGGGSLGGGGRPGEGDSGGGRAPGGKPGAISPD